ncbi:MAG: phenylalanine--tRNA ligase subunit beta [Deltaproteobacteria bacterium]|nr:phenylalanine--tRNA ligase subunit beta [Deltaproteobacteria bacterium]
MKISYRWLCEIIPGLDKIPAAELAEKLTHSGLEMEGLEDQAQKYKGIVVGLVKSLKPHPNADKLRVCEVSTGSQSTQVVCGAPNVKEGGRYPLATLGTVMPSGMEIKPVKLRGEPSSGMLCSASELELSADSNGLLPLSDHFKEGDAISEVLQLNDVVMELNITPNRGDALSHWGVAGDIAALTGLSLDQNIIAGALAQERFSESEQKGAVGIKLQSPEACGRFSVSEIKSVKVAPSPLWLAQRLESLGIRSINNVVDATNFVMLLTGHPVHAYDRRDLAGSDIIIKTLDAPTPFKTLDEQERSLVAGDLVIADQNGPVGLAGIMGGANSEIKDDSTDLVLEVAYFDPNNIRKTARRLGLNSESSYRFERFVNPDSVVLAHQKLQQLILNLAGGNASAITDAYPKPFQKKQITLRSDRVEALLGVRVADDVIQNILSRLGCEVSLSSTGVFSVLAPIGRSDLEREVDLIEEVARLQGLDKIPAEMPRLSLRSPQESDSARVGRWAKDFFVGKGFVETVHYSFTDEDLLKLVVPQTEANWEKLKNPISEDLKIMRPSLLPQLIQCYQKNRLLQEEGLRFFELRTVFSKETSGKVHEAPVLAGLYTGSEFGRNRFSKERPFDLFDGKGWLELLFKQARIALSVSEHSDWPYHPSMSMAFFDRDQKIATLGALHPELLQKFKIKEQVFVFEIAFDQFSKAFQKQSLRYQNISSFPAVYRDLALVADDSLSFGAIESCIQKHRPAWLSDVHLFDVYQGENLPAGKKSLAISMKYESPGESLTDEKVNEQHFALVDVLQKELKVALR